jgi:hypothetical protein
VNPPLIAYGRFTREAHRLLEYDSADFHFESTISVLTISVSTMSAPVLLDLKL